MQHKKEGYEVDGDQHQRKDSHQIAVRLNLKRVARRRSQETEPKRISKIEKTKHVPRRNKTCGLLRRSRISKSHNGCQEAYDGVAQASGQGKEARQRLGCREDQKDRPESAKNLHADEPLLGHRMKDALCRFPSPNH